MLLTKKKAFFFPNEVVTLQQALVTFYANAFTGGDLEVAKKLIETKNVQARKIDIALILFFIGTMFISVPMTWFLIVSEPDPDVEFAYEATDEDWISTRRIFRCWFLVWLVLVGASTAIGILRHFRINYTYIFEINPQF